MAKHHDCYAHHKYFNGNIFNVLQGEVFFKVTPMALKGQLCTLSDFKDTLLALSQAQICILKHSIPVTSECTVVLFSESVLGDTKIEKEKDR